MVKKMLLILSIFLSCTVLRANAAGGIFITVNDVYLKTDAAAFERNGRSYAPVRALANGLGADRVRWNDATNEAIITEGNTTISLTVGKSVAYVNGKVVTLNGSVRMVGDRTFAPVRFIAEQFGAKVYWDGIRNQVKIYKNGIAPVNSSAYSADNLYWLSRIVHAESCGESFEGKVGVANVILNRVKSPDFPDTIYDVIFDRNGGVQFTPVANGTIYNEPDSDCFYAARMALEGYNVVGDSLFFLNPAVATSGWITQNRTYYRTIQNHVFYA